MNKTAYLQLITSSGAYRTFKFDYNDPTIQHKIRNLKAGSVTTFDIPEEDKSFIKPLPSDSIAEQTVTIYPANVALLEIKIVESTHGP